MPLPSRAHHRWMPVRPSSFGTQFVLAALLATASGCASHGPVPPATILANKVWAPEMAVLPTATQIGDLVTVKSVRDFRHLETDSFVPNYQDRTYDLRKAESVDFIIVPFKKSTSLAHTMLSFGFSDGQYLAVSVEARREKGEAYSPWRATVGQYELMYVMADERDVISLRTDVRQDDVYLYRSKASPAQTRQLLVNVLDRANAIAARPEYYNTLANNCTTNLRDHINQVWPGRVPWDPRVLLPGRSDRLAYDLGLLATAVPFEQARVQARVNHLAERYRDAPDFSQRIRR